MRYANIIDLPHPILKNHYPMSLYNRAAQFAHLQDMEKPAMRLQGLQTAG